MSRIVLVHGFATGIHFSVFRPAQGIDAGFSAFHSDIENGGVKAFRWDIKEEASFLQSLNPFYTLGVYDRERAIAQRAETHHALHRFLEQESPEVIICHSLGAFLFFQFLQKETLPDSVRLIVFNQADIFASEVFIPETVAKRIQSGALKIVNTYCPWDPNLLFSWILNGPRAGLTGMRHTLIEERFFPLVKPINLHMAAIRSARFRYLIESLLA
ncbi:hypothetical protein COX00_01870 [Candidatus Uhrbacteria bacterium CG22_combo_CG10-13_8_21_14_all_47_17]|uniref:AB hydrolase-1 domain-containing protein n=1 Tax=Candidatus Uhrbacteria bacterium CG22_combo_CG10-13_8_21_14_all_47_17 TaxID=1975041 RepID=A0A2H0BT33_9BACT|nr:MAG: hypothetical protein COX00_01870 [Candidatus Uhrbacteria bacterium CG22_combo_CG10-13_8_21_14_all_47_17]